MTLDKIIIWIFATFGTAYIVGSSRATLPLRFWIADSLFTRAKLVRCRACQATIVKGPDDLRAGKTCPECHRDTSFTLLRPISARIGILILEGVECPACCSFHIGWIAGVAAGYRWFSLVIACAVTGTSYIIARMTGLMES